MENSQETFPAGERSVRLSAQKFPSRPPRQLFGTGGRTPHPPGTVSNTGFGRGCSRCPAARLSSFPSLFPMLTLQQEKETSRTKWSRTLTQAASEPVRAAIRSQGVARGDQRWLFPLPSVPEALWWQDTSTHPESSAANVTVNSALPWLPAACWEL